MKDRPMWQCRECGEKIEGTFDCCWNCGTDRTGKPNHHFQHADRFVAEDKCDPNDGKIQFTLRGLLVLMTTVCLLLTAMSSELSAVSFVLFAAVLAGIFLIVLYGYTLGYGILLAGLKKRRK